MPASIKISRAVVAVASVSVLVAQADASTIVDLGARYRPLSIDEKQNNVSGQFIDGSKSHAAFYQQAQGWEQLEGGGKSLAAAIDVRGSAAGGAHGMPVVWPHFYYYPVPVPMPDDFVSGTATAIRVLLPHTSWMVAGNYTSTADTAQCFLFDSEVDTQASPFPWRGDFCQVNGMDLFSTAVGGARRKPGGPTVAFTWTRYETTELGTLPGGNPPYSMAMSIGYKAGIVGCSDTADGRHAFFYFKGVMTDIGASDKYPGGTCAYGTNTDKETVGTGYDATGLPHAVRFAGGKVTPLESEIVNLGNWVLQKATGINDKGVIIGEGTRDGVVHGFMLKP